VTERVRVVVMGADEAEPPPGIGALEGRVDLRFAATREALANSIADAGAIFAWRANRELLPYAWDEARRLRWIHSASAGVDALLFAELVESDVVLTNARGVFDEAMAEYVIGLLLSFAKGLVGVVDRQRRGEWLHRETEQLAGRHVLVVGVGSIGRAIGRAALAMGMQVRGVGRTSRPGDDVFGVVLGAEELFDALGWADAVVDVLPGSAGTRHIFGAEAFAAMQPSARFVNVGRGSTVDEAALVDALRSGGIAGAALDVFEQEPLPPESPLWDLPGVIVSPHMSGDVTGWQAAGVELFAENLDLFLAGRPLRNVVDKRLGFVPGT
jgi:phosphoglycerate dehydrogenase-like enzyme